MYVPMKIILLIIGFFFDSNFNRNIPLGCDPSSFWYYWFCFEINPSSVYLTQLCSPLDIIVDLWFIHYLTLSILIASGDTPLAKSSSYFWAAPTLDNEVYEVSGGKNPDVCSSKTSYNFSVSLIFSVFAFGKFSKILTCLCSSPSTAAICWYNCEYHLLPEIIFSSSSK